jgi:signal recognition particle GTPase
VQDLEPFYPDQMASCILGMGNVISLVERASTEVTDANAARMQEKMAKAKFNFDNFMVQSKLVSSMGCMAGVAKMLPGLGNMINNSQLRMVEKQIKRSKAMICSMMKQERANLDLLLTNRNFHRLLFLPFARQTCDAQGVAFMSKLQKMRTMISRMLKQAGMGGGAEGDKAEEMVLTYVGGGEWGITMQGGQQRRRGRRAGAEGGWALAQGDSSDRGSGGKNVFFSNGPNSTSEYFNLLY